MQHQVDKEPVRSLTHPSDELSEEQLPEADGGRELAAQMVKTRLRNRHSKDCSFNLFIHVHFCVSRSNGSVSDLHILTIFKTSRIISDDLLHSSSFSKV